MSTAVYLRGNRGEENLSVYNGGVSISEISENLSEIIGSNGVQVESFMVSTTRGDYFYSELEELLDELKEWSFS